MLKIHEIIFIIYRSYRNEIEFIRFVNNSKRIFKSNWVVKIVSICSQLMSCRSATIYVVEPNEKGVFRKFNRDICGNKCNNVITIVHNDVPPTCIHIGLIEFCYLKPQVCMSDDCKYLPVCLVFI